MFYFYDKKQNLTSRHDEITQDVKCCAINKDNKDKRDSWCSLVAAKPMSTTILSYEEQVEQLIVHIAYYTCARLKENIKTTLNSLYLMYTFARGPKKNAPL